MKDVAQLMMPFLHVSTEKLRKVYERIESGVESRPSYMVVLRMLKSILCFAPFEILYAP